MSQVIAAVDWVVQHRNDNGMNIRVINLSYGTDSLQPYTVDPLAYAVEQAWKAGIVVVTAAGNTGIGTGLADPAYDPWVISVGAADTMGTPRSPTTSPRLSRPASWPGRRGNGQPPTLLAPGAHMQGLRDPGSYIDQNNPERGARRPLLPRQRHLGGGRLRNRCGRAAAAEVSAADAETRSSRCSWRARRI